MPTPTVLSQTPVTTNFAIVAKQIQMTDLYGSTGAYTGTYNIPANSDIKGCFVVTAPGGTVIYSNTNFATPDVNGGTPLWVLNVTLPTNGNGTIVTGLYTVVYTSQINDGTHTLYYVTNTATYNLSYSTPSVSITNTVNCISPNFTTVDNTNYAVGVAPTTQTRTLTLNYPYGSAGQSTPLVTSSNAISTGTFYNGTQAATVSTVLVYTYTATGSYPTFTVSDTATGVQATLVDCTFICAISCCIQSLETRMSNASNGINTVLYEQLREDFTLVMSYVELAIMAIDCNQVSAVNGYITKIKNIANCTSGCDCGSNVPSLVIGLGGNAINVIVQSGGSPVTITSNIVSGTTTYTVSLSSTFVNKVNNFVTSSVTSNNGSVTVVETSAGGNNNYDLAVSTAVPNRIELKCTISFANPMVNSGSVTITDVSVVNSGTLFVAPTIAVDDPANANWLSINNCFKVNGFFNAAPDNNYKILMNASVENLYPIIKSYPLIVYPTIFGRDNTNGAFYFKFVTLYSDSVGGATSTWNQNTGNKYELTLVISE